MRILTWTPGGGSRRPRREVKAWASVTRRISAATTNGRSRATASPSASALPGSPSTCAARRSTARPRLVGRGARLQPRPPRPHRRRQKQDPLNGDVGQGGEPELLADDGSLAGHARANQAFVVAVQAPYVARVPSGLRQRIVQVQIGTLHGVGLGDPFLHARAGQDVFCQCAKSGFRYLRWPVRHRQHRSGPAQPSPAASAFTWHGAWGLQQTMATGMHGRGPPAK
jgi:hypothetical protein